MPPRSDTAIGARDDLQQSSSPSLQKEDFKRKPNLSEIRAQIPQECFQKSLTRSLFYMVRDMGCVMALQHVYPQYVAGNWPLTIAWWNANGFMLWCLFVVGHDCGHTTFSNYPWINAICGHLCHAPLFVPFWPWAKSHNEHHKYHNHVHKDMSYPWFGREQFDTEMTRIAKFWLRTPFHPFTSYLFSYLFAGFYDGSHFNPLGVLFWNRKEQIQCAVSTVSVIAFIYVLIVMIFDFAWTAILVRHFVPVLIMNYWLVMVTYLQHHEEDTKTFDDSDFHFAEAAMETVDRCYGWGIDDVHHNITDGHVLHHLFFTKIPHYHLKKATQAVRPYLEATGIYRYRYNPNFLWTYARDNYRLSFFTHSKSLTSRAKMHYLDKSKSHFGRRNSITQSKQKTV